MKVRLGTVEFSDDDRRAIRAFHGEAGLATRDEARRFFISLAEADLESIVHEWREQHEQ